MSPDSPRPAPNGTHVRLSTASASGKIDLAGDAVAVELLVALVGVPASAQRLLVLLEPLLGVVLVAHAESRHRLELGVALAEELVECGWNFDSR